MTVGMLILVGIVVLVLAFAVGGQIAKRIMNGYWGTTRNPRDVGWFAAGWVGVAVAVFAGLVVMILSGMVSSIATTWGVPL